MGGGNRIGGRARSRVRRAPARPWKAGEDLQRGRAGARRAQGKGHGPHIIAKARRTGGENLAAAAASMAGHSPAPSASPACMGRGIRTGDRARSRVRRAPARPWKAREDLRRGRAGARRAQGGGFAHHAENTQVFEPKRLFCSLRPRYSARIGQRRSQSLPPCTQMQFLFRSSLAKPRLLTRPHFLLKP